MDIFHDTIGFFLEPWFIAIIVASIAFAAGVHIDEKLVKEQKIGTLVTISSLFGIVLMIVFATIAYFTEADLNLNWERKLCAVAIGMAEIAWVIPYLYALKRRSAAVAGPMFQLIPIIGGSIEYFMGVIPPAVQVLGAILIVVGGAILSLEKGEDENGDTKHSVDWVTIALMATSATIIALIYVLFKDVAESNDGYLAVGFWSGLGMLIAGFLIFSFYKPYREDFISFCKNADREAVGYQLLNEVMDAGGAYLTHLANIIGPSVMIVTAFNATQPIFILIFAALFSLKSGESQEWKRAVLPIVTIAAGTVLIALQ